MTKMWNNCRTFVGKMHIIMYTKKKNLLPKAFFSVLWALLVPIFMTSCMSDSESTVVESNSCYVSGVSFSTFRGKFTTKTSDGLNDSTYYVTYSGTGYVFAINQKETSQSRPSIENRDSLPSNTDLSRVVMTLTYNGAVAYHRAADAWEDDPWVMYNSTDSIDLRQPRHIRVVATDNTERIYTLKVNVHKVDADSLKWNSVAADPALDGTHPVKAVAWNGRMGVLLSQDDALWWMTHACANDGTWEKQATNLPSGTDIRSLCKSSSELYVGAEDGTLFSSADGVSWSEVDSKEGLRLAGVSGDRLYAIFDGTIHSTALNNVEWQTEVLDEDDSLLPDEEMAMLVYPQTESLTRMILLGNRKDADAADGQEEIKDTTAVVWSKSWLDFEEESTETWMHYTRGWENTQALPKLTQINLMRYDGMLVVAAGKSADGKIEALDKFFVSRDNGLTWWQYATILPPAEVKGAAGCLTAAVDEDNYLWIIAGGKVYRGRINRLGFEQ